METRSTTFFAWLLALLTICGLALPAVADEERTFRSELGIQGGFFLPDQDLSGEDSKIQELEPTAGPRFDFIFAKRFGVFADILSADMNTRTALGDAESLTYRAGFEFLFKPYYKNLSWYVELGGGLLDIEIESGPDFDRTFASLGIGQRILLDHRARFRWVVRVDHAFDDDDLLEGQDVTRSYFLIGVSWGLGRNRTDSDADGVIDRKDNCPGTPTGATVDEHGCPMDTDGDGVYDGIDKCPGTPKGAIVDEWGCPRDTDGDGVYDGIDRCPGTPRGATVDVWGCPSDSDGDGVYDGIDRCPDTPRGVIVDRWGCPKDSDGDGVYDGPDKCPNTPRGTPVNPDGCPKATPLFDEGRKTLILEGVFFEFDKDALTLDSSARLDRVARSLHDWPEVRIEIAGHTDWLGSDSYNLDLSDRRAKAVREYLVGRGVAASRINANGYGESRPIADNQTDEGRSKNRRVELNKLN